MNTYTKPFIIQTVIFILREGNKKHFLQPLPRYYVYWLVLCYPNEIAEACDTLMLLDKL